MKCKACGRTVTGDEVGLYKKLVNRGAPDAMCIDCLAAHFNCPRTLLEEKIVQFKEMGCTLFAPPKRNRE